MKNSYLFTDISGKLVHYVEFESAVPVIDFEGEEKQVIHPADVALILRKSLQEATGLKILAWSLMGKQDEEPKITNPKLKNV